MLVKVRMQMKRMSGGERRGSDPEQSFRLADGYIIGLQLTSFWKSLNSFSFLDLSCSISFDASLRASLSF